MVERKYGQARRVWVFDRGIVSDENLAAIRRRGGQYLVGTRRTTLRHVEQALLEGPWTQVRDEVEAQLIPIPGGTETYVLCRSTARREKELAIRRRFSTRLEDRLRGLETPGRHGSAERPREDRARAGAAASVVRQRRRSVRDGRARRGRPAAAPLAADRRPARLARRARRRVPVAHESRGPDGRRAVDEVHPVDRGGGRLPRLEKRAGRSARVPSTRAAREGPSLGRLSRLRALGDVETSAPPPRDRPHARRGPWRSSPRCRARTSSCRRPTAARSGSDV